MLYKNAILKPCTYSFKYNPRCFNLGTWIVLSKSSHQLFHVDRKVVLHTLDAIIQVRDICLTVFGDESFFIQLPMKNTHDRFIPKQHIPVI